MQISFQTPECCFFAEFNFSVTAREIIKILPVDSVISTLGDELYFKIKINVMPVIPTLDVNAGDVAYWPQEKCICVFYGKTPLSTGEKPVPASPVVIIGKITTPKEELRKIQSGQPIRVMPVTPAEKPAAQAYPMEKKLSQAEIDVLVQQLLAAKKKKEQN